MNTFNLPNGLEPHFFRYIHFIQTRPCRPYKAGETHRHHILPKALGGGNEEANLIILTCREHFIAHLILWKCYGGKMTKSFHFMRNKRMSQPLHLSSCQFQRLVKERTLSSMGQGNPFYGKHHTEETRALMSKNHKSNFSTITRQKISIANTGKNNGSFGKTGEKSPTHRDILCIEENKIYKGVREASRKKNTPHTNIIRACKNFSYTAGGFHWKYLDSF